MTFYNPSSGFLTTFALGCNDKCNPSSGTLTGWSNACFLLWMGMAYTPPLRWWGQRAVWCGCSAGSTSTLLSPYSSTWCLVCSSHSSKTHMRLSRLVLVLIFIINYLKSSSKPCKVYPLFSTSPAGQETWVPAKHLHDKVQRSSWFWAIHNWHGASILLPLQLFGMNCNVLLDNALMCACMLVQCTRYFTRYFKYFRMSWFW